MRFDKSAKTDSRDAALWTPWGIERPADRDAQKLAIRRLVRKVAELNRRQKLRPITQ